MTAEDVPPHILQSLHAPRVFETPDPPVEVGASRSRQLRPIQFDIDCHRGAERSFEQRYSLKHQKKFSSFIRALQATFDEPRIPHPLYGHPGIPAIIEEAREDGVISSWEGALEHLLDVITAQLGFAARDVFEGMFEYQHTIEGHNYACRTTYEELTAIINSLARHVSVLNVDELTRSRVIGVYPGPVVIKNVALEEQLATSVGWKWGFKSEWIAKTVIKQLDEAQKIVITKAIGFLRNVPDGGIMAGRFFEPLAHRHICDGQFPAIGFWPLIKMNSDGGNAPRFTLCDPPEYAPSLFSDGKREAVRYYDLAGPDQKLVKNVYYLPSGNNFPLMDAITVEVQESKKLAVLWILQVTIAKSDGGSPLGYQKIRTIIKHWKLQLQEEYPGQYTVQVRYILVVPADRDMGEQNFPAGWRQNDQLHKHRGDVYCLKIPLAIDSLVSHSKGWP
ncbi:hypothetical protein CPB84DRAFT_1748153 [Gymnopilus junonius]|uniref:Uncharacterized protein n=1 Tax=Gymnopilus junonius TaxID=109634 RepID=A0A9P5NIW4_GYMJU|nr:hypothetical protein CPB84DRAFT_1748153 [Gymnopilus junonius]